ncbi:hypothetical protein A4A49_35964 [Nicotiana attenuata]|uniref:Uncharacterized protein n=1 Tax=Nicotiana attenuata TaxID=49451 RepID=A0A314KSN1_NICAT|nr:hypothetical protein A4A49_35964 [Nicotiana attenuata]
MELLHILAMIISLILIARISSCLDTAVSSEVSKLLNNLKMCNYFSIRAVSMHAPYLDKYVTKSYFRKHDNLVDLKFEDFIAHDVLSSACVSLQDNIKFAPKLLALH